jgi:uncharacterized protein YecT (DUF1311 family)
MKMLLICTVIVAGMTEMPAGVLKPVVPSQMLEDVDAAGLEESLWELIPNSSTRAMNDGNSISLALWEAKLLQVYVRLSATLNEADARALVKEQLAWIEERDKVAEKEGSSEEGGSAQGVMEKSSLVKQTKGRVAELEKRLVK